MCFLILSFFKLLKRLRHSVVPTVAFAAGHGDAGVAVNDVDHDYSLWFGSADCPTPNHYLTNFSQP
jgi:hypothetical protein